MAISKETVSYVAHLARMRLETAEIEKLSVQLQDILDFIDVLKKADISNVQPTSHILPVENVLREDAARGSIEQGKALENAPAKKDGFFGVPKVI
jgi:aspartyl-tRNA(Asn)/glutamyl-tRNA(Gln) amidotransferase subunit C